MGKGPRESRRLFPRARVHRRGKDGTSIKDQERVKGFQGGRTNRAYAVIATVPMNDAVYDSPIPIDCPD